ncbi:MAG: hypothetical protein IJU39_02815 [Clostridia bacterium]|nr:hypothetical protein [Clostridia bacterium]
MTRKASKIKNCARVEYVKVCPYCGKVFKVEYPYMSYMAYVDAKDTVNAYISSHKSFCGANA